MSKQKTVRQNKFEYNLSNVPHERKHSIITVADTMEICKSWFDVKGIKYKASDLTTMAALMLGRKG